MRPAASARDRRSSPAAGRTRSFRIARASSWRSRRLSCAKQSSSSLCSPLAIAPAFNHNRLRAPTLARARQATGRLFGGPSGGGKSILRPHPDLPRGPVARHPSAPPLRSAADPITSHSVLGFAGGHLAAVARTAHRLRPGRGLGGGFLELLLETAIAEGDGGEIGQRNQRQGAVWIGDE